MAWLQWWLGKMSVSVSGIDWKSMLELLSYSSALTHFPMFTICKPLQSFPQNTFFFLSAPFLRLCKYFRRSNSKKRTLVIFIIPSVLDGQQIFLKESVSDVFTQQKESMQPPEGYIMCVAKLTILSLSVFLFLSLCSFNRHVGALFMCRCYGYMWARQTNIHSVVEIYILG